MYSGPCQNPYRSNRPHLAILTPYLRKNNMTHLLRLIGVVD
jgi:hypothetical protein